MSCTNITLIHTHTHTRRLACQNVTLRIRMGVSLNNSSCLQHQASEEGLAQVSLPDVLCYGMFVVSDLSCCWVLLVPRPRPCRLFGRLYGSIGVLLIRWQDDGMRRSDDLFFFLNSLWTRRARVPVSRRLCGRNRAAEPSWSYLKRVSVQLWMPVRFLSWWEATNDSFVLS